MGRFQQRLSDVRGATLPEYCLLLSLLTVVAIPSIQLLGSHGSATFWLAGQAMGGYSSTLLSTDGGTPGVSGQSDHQESLQDWGGGTTSDQTGTADGVAPPTDGSGKDDPGGDNPPGKNPSK